MAKSDRPRLKELREIYLLVGECRSLGSDPVVWRRHMLERLCGITRAAIGLGGEARPNRPQWEQRMVDVGWPDQHQRATYQRWITEHRPEENPFAVGMFARSARLVTHYRRQLVDDETWYGSAFFQMLHSLELDDLLGSYFVDSRGYLQIIGLQREHGAPPFGQRERRLVSLFQRELMPLTGNILATFERPTVGEMAPRLRQTLLCLLQGDGEQQAARRLGIAPHTVHEYVTKLHRHFDVASRGELLARCIGLYPVLVKLEQAWNEHLTTVATSQGALPRQRTLPIRQPDAGS